MKRIIWTLSLFILLLGCSYEINQLSTEELKDLPIDEQVKAVVDNTELIEGEYEVVVDGNSVAIVYSAKFISDNRLVLGHEKDGFPNVAMTLAEHLLFLDLDELVVTSYEPKETEGITGLTKVSAMFTGDTINKLNFDKWKSDKKDRPERFYRRHVDAYFIRGNVWEKLSEEEQDLIGFDIKDSDSDFWDYYGKHIE